MKHSMASLAIVALNLVSCAPPDRSVSASSASVTSPSGARIDARYLSAFGWVRPGESYSFTVDWAVGSAGASSAVVSIVLPPGSVFTSASPAPTSGTGSAQDPLLFSFPALLPNHSARIVINARAMSLAEDPEIMWKDLSANASLAVTTGLIGEPAIASRTLGPKVTTHQTARYGERPFPLVMVEYQDITHCTGPGQPFEECTGNHTNQALDAAVNSRTSGRSVWQLYTDMSFGQLSPLGQVRPPVGAADTGFDPLYPYKFSTLQPAGACTGVTLASVRGTPLYPRRIEDGWYVLPGTQGYYGSDRFGHGLAGALTGVGLVFGVDDACGPTAKIAYDAAAIADPDLDYSDFDTDKDGVVDFLNVAFAGDGGNGNATATGINNVWPHKSDLRFYFRDANGETGYVSNDQLRDHLDRPMYWVDSSREEMTTDPSSGLPVFVRVGPYNVNPESAIEHMSVIAHEYGHSLGLPDFYSLGSRGTMGSWELMASDHAQFMTVFSRQELGWIVPMEAEDAVYTLAESKIDTGRIRWRRPDGTPYELTGVHNGDALRIPLPTPLLIESVPSGERAWHSGSGNDFGCPGHTLDVWLPDLANFGGASAVTLRFQSWYEIEWDFDYGFVLASIDGGQTWTSLASNRGTTISGFNPNQNECIDRYGNGITGSSGQPNALTNPDRVLGEYPEPVFIEDEFDLTPYRGQQVILRFAYSTDPGLAKRGWFIDDIAITADGTDVYRSDFETSEESGRLFPANWQRISSADGSGADHAYYVEVRDRVGFDLDGRGQSERGPPTWQPGVAVLYTDESHGYGNTGVDNPPAQTIVDSVPDPGNDLPILDDAAFIPQAGRDKFDACRHIDNYSTPDGLWQLPRGVALTVTSFDSVSAQIIADVDPDCSLVFAAPVLAFGQGHSDPDPDGSFELTWSRPAGAAGADQIQEATLIADLFRDDAESGLSRWSVTTTGVGAFAWEPSSAKVNGGSSSFWARAIEGAANATSVLALASPIAIPPAGRTTLSWFDWAVNEGDDQVSVEVSEDGATWNALSVGARAELAPDAVTAFATEEMRHVVLDLAAYAGRSILVRFVYAVGAENRAGSTPFGWYVDDISVQTENWYDVGTTSGTSFLKSGLDTGTYHYRVRSSFPAGAVSVFGPWSNVITARVERAPGPAQLPDVTVSEVQPINHKGKTSKRVTLIATVRNDGDASMPASRTEFVLDGATSLGTIDTPAIAPGGSVDVSVQWDTRGENGEHTVRITTDSQGAALESSEANNVSTRTFQVKGNQISNP